VIDLSPCDGSRAVLAVEREVPYICFAINESHRTWLESKIITTIFREFGNPTNKVLHRDAYVKDIKPFATAKDVKFKAMFAVYRKTEVLCTRPVDCHLPPAGF
jgi:hypothetical protein